MKIFISHHIGNDESLATELQTILKDHNIEGIIAQRKQEYELYIVDKIKQQIDSSDHLVAIITKDGLASASVHEEIGYAIGKNIPVALMVEEEIEERGVLIHGRDPEYFTRKFFKEHASNVIKYIITKGVRIQHTNTINSDDFIKKRNLLLDTAFFGQNSNSEELYQTILAPKKYDKAFVLFSACPQYLKDDRINITSQEFTEWLSKHDHIEIQGHKIPFSISGKEKISIDSITYHWYPYSPKNITRYFEFNQNGFMEVGITDPLVFEDRYHDAQQPYLHLCWLTGVFWTFLKFCREYYAHIDYKQEFDVYLSIRNSDKLMLFGFGGKTANGTEYLEPDSSQWHADPPLTKMPNISLSIKGIKFDDLTDDFIGRKVQEFSNKISNAYGLKSARCYNHDGSFSFELFSYYQ